MTTMLEMRKIAIQTELEMSPNLTDICPSTLQPLLMMSRMAWQAHVQGRYLDPKSSSVEYFFLFHVVE